MGRAPWLSSSRVSTYLPVRATPCSWLLLLPCLLFFYLWFLSTAGASGFSFPCFLFAIPHCFRFSITRHLIFEHDYFGTIYSVIAMDLI